MPQQSKQIKNRCIYCGSTDYGKGCRFGPHGTHFHPDNSTKCSYCGSSDYGKGCKLNPINNIHVHGSAYNNMYKETLQSFLDTVVLIKELKKCYTEFECYKVGIIDENGNKIKSPSNITEEMSYTPFVKTILRIKKYLGHKIDLLETSNSLESVIKPLNENINHYKKVLEYQDKIDVVINELYTIINQAQNEGIPFEQLNRLLKT